MAIGDFLPADDDDDKLLIVWFSRKRLRSTKISAVAMARVPCISHFVDDPRRRTGQAAKKFDVLAAHGAIHEQDRLLEFEVACGFPLAENLESLAESFPILDRLRLSIGTHNLAN